MLGVLALSAALDGPDVSATAAPRCLAGRAYVAVRATNDGAVPADVTLSTPFGERTVAGVAPGASAYQSFSARSATLDAGSALVTATGDGRSSSDDVAYPALDCG